MARRLAGRYVLGNQIGVGGTSRVHEAYDERLGRRVAVKLLDASLVASADPAGRERFAKEGRTTAGFNHRHAVTVFDAGEDDGDLFIVMELVKGESLAELLARRGPLPIAEVVSIAGPLTSVLSAAHAAGIVHRDVKPANVLLADGGEGEGHGVVKLADFGIAKRFDDLEGSVTATGMVVGTPRYLAPEQAVGSPVSPATDVYALGTVLFEMLTGRPPVVAESMVAAAMVQQSQPAPDVRSLRPEVPATLAALVARALERAPADRFATAGEMAVALHDAWAPGAESLQASVPTQVFAAVAAPAAASGRRGGDTLVQPAMPSPLPAPATVEAGAGAGAGPEEASPGRLGVVLVFLLALLLGVAVVAVVRDAGDRTERVAPNTSTEPRATQPPVTQPPVTEPAVAEPPVTDPAVGEPAVAEPPVAEPPVAELIPGFPATDDLWVFLEQLERDPDLGGEKGDDVAEDLREVLEARGGDQRPKARELREDLAEWVEEGEIEPAIAAALDALLAPLADR
ncbi:MAG TPA: protein kinase [Ilumatobacteraceae bacterium]|nr:protein kinase [Ilumatobacteraceae bacterium]